MMEMMRTSTSGILHRFVDNCIMFFFEHSVYFVLLFERVHVDVIVFSFSLHITRIKHLPFVSAPSLALSRHSPR
jgi:hypothetical protein